MTRVHYSTHLDVELRFVHGKVVVLAPDLFGLLDVGHGRDSDQTVRRQFAHVLGRLHESVQVFFCKRDEKKKKRHSSQSLDAFDLGAGSRGRGRRGYNTLGREIVYTFSAMDLIDRRRIRFRLTL